MNREAVRSFVTILFKILLILPLVGGAGFPSAVKAEDSQSQRNKILYKTLGEHWYSEADRGYFRLYNIESGSTLDLYAGPSLKARSLKALRNGEIVASDGVSHWGGEISWRKVTHDLTDGWVPERYLKRARPRVIEGTGMPGAGMCRGFDPAWILTWSGKVTQLGVLFPRGETLSIQSAVATDNLRSSLLTASSENLTVKLIYSAGVCALVSGSSRVGASGHLLVTHDTKTTLHTGCCQATADAFTK